MAMATRSPRPPLRLVIFDMDGVLYRGHEPVAGAAALVGRVHGAGLVVRYATNNAMFTRDDLAVTLETMGIAAGAEEIVTSTSATIDHLGRHEARVRTVLAVGTRGMVSELRAAGYAVTQAADAANPADLGDRGLDAVVVGLDPDFDASRLAAAVKAVAAGARFFATNADMRYPTPTGFRPGAGAIVAAIRDACGVTPFIVGKPEPAMFKAILESTGIGADEALVIGDNPASDIVAAHRSGIESVLVLTGVIGPDAVAELRGDQVPDHVRADLGGAWDLIGARLSG